MRSKCIKIPAFFLFFLFWSLCTSLCELHERISFNPLLFLIRFLIYVYKYVYKYINNVFSLFLSFPRSEKKQSNMAANYQKNHPLPEDKFIVIGKCVRTNVPISICYNTFGNPENPCVLLINGLGSSLLVWHREFCEKIAEKGYYVIRLDNRDVGLSTHLDGMIPPNPLLFLVAPRFFFGNDQPFYTLEDMARDAVGLLNALSITKAHIVGASMGGMIAQCIAIEFPQYVKTLTIFYSHASGPNTTPPSLKSKWGLLDRPKSNSFDDIVAFKVRQRKRSFGRYGLSDEEVMKQVLEGLHRSPEDRDAVRRQMWAIVRATSREKELKDVTVPTLIIHGNEDTLVPLANGLNLVSLMPNSVIVIYPGMRHYIPRELFEDMVGKMVFNFKKAEE